MRSLQNRLDRTLLVLALLGLAFHFYGVALNIVATIGSGSMQVVEKVKGSAILDYDEKTRHISREPSLLVDQFQVDLPDIRVSSRLVQRAIDTWCNLLNYPPGGGMNLVSIGDILRWIGSLLFLLTLPILIVRIPFRIARDGMQFRLR